MVYCVLSAIEQQLQQKSYQIPWLFSSWDFMLSLQRARVQSLVGEQRYKLLCAAKQEKQTILILLLTTSPLTWDLDKYKVVSTV